MRFIGYAASLTSGFYLLSLLEREIISKFAPVYLGWDFQRKPGAATYAPTPLEIYPPIPPGFRHPCFHVF